MRSETDLIVIGGGGSGLAAAVSAAEHGLAVLLLEKNPWLGGTTGMAVGSFTAANTAMQRDLGIDDQAADHAEDAARFAPPEIEVRNNDPLRRFFLEQAAETLHWLEAMGLSFYGPSPEPPNRAPRMHNVVPNARAYISTLQARLLSLGGEIVCNAAVRELMKRSGRVAGVRVEQEGEFCEVAARRGAVLATGDYANSATLIAEFKGERFAGIEGINPHATGDGHRLARDAGARLLNMDVTYGPEIRFVPPHKPGLSRLLPASGPLARLAGMLLSRVPKKLLDAFIKGLVVTWQHPENSLFDDGAILVNLHGRRFCDERRSPEREIAIAAQPEKLAYLLLDERLMERYGAWPHFISTAPQIAYAYVDDYLRLRPDVAVVAATLSEIARLRNMDADWLAESVEQANAERHVGQSFQADAKPQAAVSEGNSQAGKPDLRKLNGNRWLLLGPAKAYFTTTEGGCAINEQFQVLDEVNQPIPGLFAVGQIGLGGQILWGHGLHIAWALTSGRLVGKQLAERRELGSH